MYSGPSSMTVQVSVSDVNDEFPQLRAGQCGEGDEAAVADNDFQLGDVSAGKIP